MTEIIAASKTGPKKNHKHQIFCYLLYYHTITFEFSVLVNHFETLSELSMGNVTWNSNLKSVCWKMIITTNDN